MENKYVKQLKDISKKNLEQVGGKAANLGELLKTDFPVPDGFVLTINAYNSFIEYNDIKAKIEVLIEKIDKDDFENIKIISKEIRKLFKKSIIPKNITAEINQFYEQLEQPQVVVRSSAAKEDSPTTSFAGLYDSFLNINGKEQLYKHIKLCWASLWNVRAISYRLQHNIKGINLGHAVVVQKLIQADKSGILFTANPVNNRRDQILINSAWGLGEAIVSGDVNPDQWIVNKNNEQIVVKEIAEKKKMTVWKNKGTELVDVPLEKQKMTTLSDDEVHELSKLAKKVANYYNSPQDIEWGFYNNNFYLLQTRPITTLFPKIEVDNGSNRLRVYINFLLIDKVMPEPLTPLGVDIWKLYLKRILPADWVKSAAGRLFVDITEISRLERWWNKLSNNSFAMDPLTIKTMISTLQKNKDTLKEQRKSFIKLIPTLLSFISPSFLKFVFTSMYKALYGLLFSPEKVVEKAYQYGENQIKLLKEETKSLESKEEKIAFIEENALSVYYFIPLQVLYYVINSLNYLQKSKKIIRKHLDCKYDLSIVEKSLPNNVTTEMAIDLLKIAQKFAETGENLSTEHPEIKNFLDKYGHRTYLEVDPGVSRWQEKPEYIIDLIKSYMKNKSYQKRLSKFYQDRERADQLIAEINNKLKEKGAHRQAKKVKKLLTNYRKLFGVRELPKYIMTKGVAIFREILLEVGEELKLESRLNSKNDIFFVRLQDIKSERKLQDIVEENREMYKKELKRSSVPRVVTSTGETIYYPNIKKADNVLVGIPVSAGVQEGKVRVLGSPDEAEKLNKGDILVTKATNPAWTPLFLEIGGLITEMGGPISHGSVVAREYGVPAIAGLHAATTSLKDGQIIRLNGETGEVEIIK